MATATLPLEQQAHKILGELGMRTACLLNLVSTTETHIYFAHAYSNGIQFLKRCAALGLPFLWASPAWAAQVSSLFGL